MELIKATNVIASLIKGVYSKDTNRLEGRVTLES